MLLPSLVWLMLKARCFSSIFPVFLSSDYPFCSLNIITNHNYFSLVHQLLRDNNNSVQLLVSWFLVILF